MTHIATNVIAGPFSVKYAGNISSSPTAIVLGVIGSRGIRQIRKFEGEDFASSQLGNSVIDTVYMGGQMFLEFELEEANNAGVHALTNQMRQAITSAPTSSGDNEMGIPGTLMSSMAGTLTLNPLYSATGTIDTSAGSEATPVRTYGLVMVASGFEQELLYHSNRRTIPIRLRCYPYLNSDTPAKYVWYTTAAVDSTYRLI